MRQILLATVAAVALTCPAMAQTNTQQTAPNRQGQMQQSADKQSGGQQSQRIDPSKLGKQEVRQIQQALNKKGLSARKADGVWGPRTEAALRRFQEKQNIKAGGQLTQQTLAALGVNVQAQNRKQKPSEVGTTGAAPASTTGSGSGDMNSKPGGAAQPHSNQMKTNQPNAGKGSNY